MAWRDATTLSRVAVVLIIIGLILTIIAFATPGWSRLAYSTTTATADIGLWQTCGRASSATSNVCTSMSSSPLFRFPEWFKVCQAMATLALVFAIAALVCIICYVFIYTFEKDKRMKVGTAVVCFLTFAFMLIAVVIWAVETTKINWGLYYSFGVGVAAAVMFLISFIVTCIM